MIRVRVSIDDGKEMKHISNALTSESLSDRALMIREAEELMSVLLDSLGSGLAPLGKQAREELARREQHEREVRQMREVTHDEWLLLPLERSVAKQGPDGKTRFYDAGEVRGG